MQRFDTQRVVYGYDFSDASSSSDTAETTSTTSSSHLSSHALPGLAHLERIWSWNASVPSKSHTCVHTLFSQTAARQPSADAIDAWDGRLTYAQLDALTDRIAKHLVLLGVNQSTLVPLCFEKSKWTPVAALAVMKAGGACVGMDVSQPVERLRSIVSQLNAQLILTSSSKHDLAGKIGSELTQRITLDDETVDTLFADPLSSVDLPAVNPNSLVYIVFTSGSTGTPKGVMVTHANMASAVTHQQAAHHFHPRSRVYDFASYAFDVAWSNVIHTLTVGGVLCIPSEEERKNDLAESLARYHVTYLDITPSLARVLPASAFKQLETVTLGGEALPAQHAQIWASMVDNLNNPYGPSECTPTATITRISADEPFTGSIGRGLGLNTWVVDPVSGDALMPVGETGELWLEGPLVGAGYFNDKEKTQKAFILDPPWLRAGCGPEHPGRSGRLFRTGDLVRYNPDGSLNFMGRKDAQVKINGQRVELGEIEHQIALALPQNAVADVVAEMVDRQGSSSKMLVAFLEFKSFTADDEELFLEVARKAVDGLSERLREKLPAYMVPVAYVPLKTFPMTGTGKTDRRALRQRAEAMSLGDLSRLNAAQSELRAPATEVEVLMHALWAAVLGVDKDTFGLDDNFLHLGGDSIAAMKLVAAAREFGIVTTVAQIFGNPRLESLCGVVTLVGDAAADCPAPFSLLQRTDAEQVRLDVSKILDISPGLVEDVFPCTPLQEGLLSMTEQAGGDYVVSYPLQLHSSIDLGRLTVAWDKVVANNPILRTRVVDLAGQGLVQVIVDEVPELVMTTGSVSTIRNSVKIGLGSPLSHFTLVRNRSEDPVTFLWTMHHAVYDGWTVRILVDQVYQAYMGEDLSPIPAFQNFLEHVVSIDKDAAANFWTREFQDLDAPVFPRLPAATYTPKQDTVHEHTVDNIQWPKNGVTASTIIRSALALLLADYSASDDVLFGVTVSGRQAAVAGVDQMTGPTIATIPVRVPLAQHRSGTVEDMLAAVQDQAIAATDYEQLGLQTIKKMSAAAERACQFQTLLVVQPKEEDEMLEESVFYRAGDIMDLTDKESFAELSSNALVIECHFTSSQVKMQLSCDSRAISEAQVTRFAGQLQHVMQQLCLLKSAQVADIETVSSTDLQTIWAWNETVPKTHNVCVHDIFSQTAFKYASKTAIEAWDGSFTYKQLDTLSTQLAHSLSTYKIAGTVVPLCFTKSKWTPVAVWGVMKAGAASVTLDTSQPEERLRTIIDQVEPVLMLASSITSSLANTISPVPVHIVDTALTGSSSVIDSPPLPAVDPSSRLYIVFTSGSTGTPKGVTITHANFSSAILHQQTQHRFKPTSRVYDFASYAFDVSWSNILHTLTIGACLCIPADEARKDDLAGSILSFNSTHADLTPSAAAILPEHVMKSLDTIVLGGEKVPEAATSWAKLVDVINPYGPSECTPTATLTAIQPGGEFTGSIGRGLGLNTWVVSTQKDALVPVGAVGELWLEGPLVGAGYIGDATKTAAAFVEDPSWLLTHRTGRLYKTGDLVRYSDDGELIFLGRKDAQVKINGQRVELSEIESHIERHPAVRRAACVIPKSGACAGRLTAVVSFHGESSSSFDFITPSEATAKQIEAVETSVEATLPAYMIPAVWIPATTIPLNVSGKLNYRELLDRLDTIDKTFVSRDVVDVSGPSRLPRTEAEQLLRQVCSAVLNISEDAVHLDQSFIANGGDSISAMRLASQCRASGGLTVSVGQLLKSKSLAAFALTLKKAETETRDVVQFNVPFELSPIQRWYFEQMKPVTADQKEIYCNQGCYLKLNKTYSVDELTNALYAVVEAHPMLRASFKQTNATWMQTIPSFDKNAVNVTLSNATSQDEVAALATSRHQSLDPLSGRVFTADIVTLASGEINLVMVAHHLVMDLVSWRIISDDLEAALANSSLQSSLSFQTWTSKQIQHASTLAPQNVLSTSAASSNLSFWNFTEATPNAVVDQHRRIIHVGAETTTLVLGDANARFNTEPVDILIAAVWDAFFQTFSERGDLTIFSEGHGREAWTDAIDLSKTVGWFTTISPLYMAASKQTAELVRAVKDARRFLPANGFSYFASRYLSDAGKKAFQKDTDAAAMEVVFNYHGQFQQFENQDAVFLPVDLGIAEVGPQLPASSLFGIEVSIEAGITKFEFSANKHIAHQDRIEQWASSIKTSLENICAELAVNQTPARTLHDYLYLGLDYASLDTLETSVLPAIEALNKTTVEAVLPPNPTVDGILISQLKEPESYKTVQYYELSATDIDIAKLVNAWKVVVAAQPGLRSVFTPSLDTNTSFYQVILASHEPEVVIVDASSHDEATKKIKQLPSVDYSKSTPPHRVALAQISSSSVLVCIDMSHAITDGTSNGIIAQNWIDAYAGKSPITASNLLDTMTSFAAHLHANPADQKLSYWSNKLADAKPCTFPELNNHSQEKTYSVVEAVVDGPALSSIQAACAKLSITPASIVQSAWALTLATYLGTSSVSFGYLASGRDLEITGLDESIGAYTNMLVCYADINYAQPGTELAQSMYAQILEDLKYQHSSLAAIHHSLGLNGQSLFNSIMSFQMQEGLVGDESGLVFKTLEGDDPTEYDVVVNVGYSTESIHLLIDYSTLSLSSEQAKRMASLFCTLMSGMLAPSPLSRAQSVSEADMQQIQEWNAVVPATKNVAVHELIQQTTQRQPDALAIDAWDGQWTYAQLDAITTKLAAHLVSLGAQNTIIPAVFEKSKWTPVVMLAVMKAGAATVLMDPNQPLDRLRAIVQQVDPVIILSSASNHGIAVQLGISNVLAVTSTLFETALAVATLPQVNPASPIYLVFTSGSTGLPKGVVVTHANISSAIEHQRAALAVDSTSRIYDYSSYMFDVVWCNLLQGLTAGSCICIPTDEDRKTNLVDSIVSFGADTVIMTPSAVRGLEINKLTTLKNLHFIGEALRTEIFQDLPASVTVTNLYGPTECTTYSTCQRVAPDASGSVSIGLGSGTTPWIVHPDHGDALVPVGAIGELCIEGPLVATGYLGDAEKTNAVFVEDPAWLPRRGRVYKTGDLVSYNADGSLTFMGRKDAQVKLNGQRVELGEIEYHVQEALSDDEHSFQVIAEVVTPEGGSPMLVAFVSPPDDKVSSTTEDALAALVQTKSSKLDGQLASILPPHMIPAAYIPVMGIPKTPSGKTDRKVLRAQGKAMSIESLSSSSSEKRQPTTSSQRVMQALWAAVLSQSADTFGLDDSFLRVGGDSITAMKLVGKAREQGISLSVADVFANPRLEDMALKAGDVEVEVEEIVPFSLLSTDNLEAALQTAASQCSVDKNQIVDMYPCTALQEGMMALTIKRPGDYVLRCVFELKDSVDITTLRASWDALVSASPVLRTRIVDLAGHLSQVVLDETAHWHDDRLIAHLDEIHEPEAPIIMELGTPLLVSQIVTNTTSNKHFLVATLHHAIYDGWSLNLVFDHLEKMYLGTATSSPSDFRHLVKHASSIDKADAKSFWTNQFAGSEAAAFPALPTPMYEPVPRDILTHSIDNIVWPSSTGITPSTLVRGAISILVSKYTDTRDVIYGVTSSGRQAAIPGIENMVGPAIATVPFRAAFQADETLHQFLSSLQQNTIEMTRYEQTGLQHIRKASADADKACQFQLLVIVQPADEASEWNSAIIERDIVGEGVQELDTYALTLECQLGADNLKIKASFDDAVISKHQTLRFAQQLEHVLVQLCASTASLKMDQVAATSTQDLDDVWTWNETVPEAVDAAVHDLIHQRALLQPSAPAVCAWDGDFTYKQMDELSTQLAHRLVAAGISSTSTIPLFFEKSKWTPIAMVAANKAGASAVAVDCGQPDDRLLSIISQVEAPLILCSSSKQAIAQRLVPSIPTIVVDESAFVSNFTPTSSLPKVDPSSKLYIVFTSGSTGTPKGVMITHRNMASAIKHQKVIQCIYSTSRVFDFASYAFDVAWANTMCSFEVGACLCIPSDADRKDDLSGAVLRLRATHADLTPSAALVLSVDALKQLHTLTLGGERLTLDNASKWAEHTIVKNSYGPSECTPSATFSDEIHCGDDFNGTIGKGSGMLTWIVDAETGSSLVPIGAIGELWLEGPCVGDGYLNDPIKTEKAFVTNPAWLAKGHKSVSGRQGRLYKTGDLVRYNMDGSIDFIGRKDAQVKINGQRVELTEIETHITAHSDVFQAACFWVTSGPCARRLICALSIRSLRRGDVVGTAISLPSEEEVAQFDAFIEDIKTQLKTAVPGYMVPAIWIPMFDLPQTASGKMNGKALKDWLVNMDEATHARIKSDAQTGTARAAETEAEVLLSEACSAILNIPVSQINLEASFIANGGDSITAMQIASACRSKGLAVSVAQLLRAKTLAEFAASTTTSQAPAISYTEEYNKLFSLSPIQQWYFGLDLDKDATDQQYNQGFYLKLTKPQTVPKVRDALTKIVDAHSMLRARFETTSSGWMQKVLPPSSDNSTSVYHFEAATVDTLDQVEKLAMDRQHSLDITNGPLFSADLCTLSSGEQYLVLIAHHIIIDLVSWRVIMDDLETLLTTDNSLIGSLPFQLWNKLQIERASLLSPSPAANTSANTSFWGFVPGTTPNRRGDHECLTITADEKTTLLLLNEANRALNTEPLELLLSAAWHAFLTAFPMRSDGLTIFNEAHGREPWTDDIDISKTVGWFTTMAPIHISQASAQTTLDLVRNVKDARRQMPGNGWNYFASRYLNNQDTQFDNVMEVLFNYHGQFHQLDKEDAFFQDIALESVVEQGLGMPESSLFNFEVSIENNQTEFAVSFNKHLAHQDEIRAWMTQIGRSLEIICADLIALPKTKTLVDYEFLQLDYAGLDKLEQQILPALGGIDDIYPCKPTVDGILLSQIKDPEAYKTMQIYTITHPSSLDIDRLASAWNQVVARQPALRTVFIAGLDDQAAFNQVILSSHSADIITIEASDAASALAKMDAVPATNYQDQRPPHRITICMTSPTSAVCKIEMSHAITDGFSSSLVIDEWIAAYSSSLGSSDLLEATRTFNRVWADKPTTERLSFWTTKLGGMEPSHFPRLTETSVKETGNQVLNIEGDLLTAFNARCAELSVTPSSVVMAAWALTLSAYSGLNSVAFGYLASGRDLPIAGLDECVGAFANMMVLRADAVREQSDTVAFLGDIHGQVMQDLSFQHCSLASIQYELGLGPNQTLFNSIMSFQRVSDDAEEEDSTELTFKNMDGLDPTEYDIVLGVSAGSKLLEIELDYSTLHLTDIQATAVLSLMKDTISRLISPSGTPLSFISPQDATTIWTWNASVPETIHRAVHDIISDTVAKQPAATAIHAWDGDWTYQELEDKSTLLAHRLLDLGISNTSIVPLCFEKSRWTPLATLAVMKAGACAVTLDPSQPADRLRTIISQVSAPLILSSSTNEALANSISSSVLVVNDTLFSIPRTSKPLPPVDPSSKLYLNFTSGTTGTPKGVIVTHANYASAIVHQQAQHLFKHHSRVYDFASYAFDVSWSNLLHTLTIGAVLCIPSDADRKDDLAGSIERLGATHADLTPSAASTLPLETFAKLETVVLGGEKLSPEFAKSWSALVNLINPYGPSECTPTATLVHVDPNEPFSGSIGRGIGLNTWIVDAITGDSLVPVGSVGELLLEGPLVGDGYLNNPEKTAAAFIEDPAWLTRGNGAQSGRQGRLYKTGDLVKYAPDGSLIFIGRKDNQVKINGQRVEMGDIEHHVQTCLGVEGLQTVVELIQPENVAKKVLVAFISSTTSLSSSSLAIDNSLSESIKTSVAGINERLAAVIPSYMIPSAYIALSALPIATTGKTDRKRLRDFGSSLTWAQLGDSSSQTTFVEPQTPNEHALRRLWATVLHGITESRIGSNDSFLKIGGDSIGAMRLVTAARGAGFQLSVADVLRYPKLSEMALSLHALDQSSSSKPYEPFSLVPSASVLLQAAETYNIDPSTISDIMPVTGHQSRLISMTYTSARTLLIYHTLDGAGSPDLSRMRLVCQHLVSQYDMLRTVFFAHGPSFYQAVLTPSDLTIPLYSSAASLDAITEQIRVGDTTQPLRYGALLTAFSVIHSTSTNTWRIVARLSHAQHDGMSMAKLWTAFEDLYHSSAPISPPTVLRGPGSFSNYMHALSQTDKPAARAYWRSLLAGSSMTTLKPRSSLTVSYGEGPFLVREIPHASLPASDTTFSTVLRAAWAYVLSQKAQTSDVVFSCLTHGRSIPNAQDVFGACVNVVPTRMQIQPGWTPKDLIAAIKAQNLASMDHEHLGSRDIIRECTAWPKWTYAGSVVYYHNLDDGEEKAERSMHDDSASDSTPQPDVDNTDLHITAKPSKSGIRIEFGFAADVMSDADADTLADELIRTILSFYTDLDTPLTPVSSPMKLHASDGVHTKVVSHDAATKAAVTSAWDAVFPGQAPFHPYQTIFDLGADISSVAQLCAHLQTLGREISIEQVLENPTREGQAAVLSLTLTRASGGLPDSEAPLKTSKNRGCFPYTYILEKLNLV